MDYKGILKQNRVPLPAALVDLDRFDENLSTIARTVEGTSLKIRIATKSIRVPELIKRALDSSNAYKGLMCFSAQEAEFLAQQGFNDFLIAYPTIADADLQALKRLHDAGTDVKLVVDHIQQLQALNKVFQGSGNKFPVIVEVDVSLRIGPLVLGVRRSPLRSKTDVAEFIRQINASSSLKFEGLMAYEAQVAGVTDRNPFKPLLSLVLKPLRKFMAKRVAKFRGQLVAELRAQNISFSLFNGGGTGSLSFNKSEANVLTELTAGSGFYCPHLFDYYTNLNLKPSAYFALQVVRFPEPGWITCQGGGYIASGEPSWDRIPKPEQGYSFSPFEATGEVQTPLKTNRQHRLGDIVLFRHAKAGELFERFNDVVLISAGRIERTVKSYRGFGQNYF